MFGANGMVIYRQKRAEYQLESIYAEYYADLTAEKLARILL